MVLTFFQRDVIPFNKQFAITHAGLHEVFFFNKLLAEKLLNALYNCQRDSNDMHTFSHMTNSLYSLLHFTH